MAVSPIEPMLRYVTDCIFDSPAQTLVNTVNTDGVMGKGIAAEFKSRYPEMYREYREHCRAGHLTVGKLYLYRTPHKWILNFPTKEHWRRPSKPEYIQSGLQKFVATYAERGITSVAFPQLGTGNGGLDWASVVEPLMREHLSRVRIPVFVHVRNTDAPFVPEHVGARERHLETLERAAVTFATFLADLGTEAGMNPDELTISSTADGDDDAAPLPVMRLRYNGDEVDVQGEDLEELWHALMRRGALSTSDFPSQLRDLSSALVPLLTRLPYVKPIALAVAGSEHQNGIRFAPPPTTDPPRLVSSGQRR